MFPLASTEEMVIEPLVTAVAVTDAVTNYAGTFRTDLGNEIDTLRFAVAQDLYAENTVGTTYDVAFLGNSNRLAFIAATDGASPTPNLGVWLESTGEKYPEGWLQTGQIRYNTLEQKNFKRIVGLTCRIVTEKQIGRAHV